jgi:hypothetical protein
MYSTQITRKNPSAFILLIDQSGSTEEKTFFGTQVMSKADAIAMVANMLLREIINRCQREEGIRDYFEIAAIGYSDDGARMLLDKKDFVRPSTLARSDVRQRTISRERLLPDGSTRIYDDRLSYWIEPLSEGATPMRAALERALTLVERWCRKPANRDSYPPTIFNITDGEASDGDRQSLVALAREIGELKTNDGNVLLININISSGEGLPVLFPSSPDELPESRYARTLYEMSSEMPAEYNDLVMGLKGSGARPPFRAMGVNASVVDMVSMLNIGSRSVNKML